jgi:hypothetical protein
VEIRGGTHTTGDMRTTTGDILITYEPNCIRLQDSAGEKANEDERDISR